MIKSINYKKNTLLIMAKGFTFIDDQNAKKLDKIIEDSGKFAKKKGFVPLFVPTVGEKEIFIKKIGEQSDIVTKEIFSLGAPDDHLMLRPEFTALIGKYLESTQKPMRLLSIGSNFRRERPQAGRLREFYQINLEIIKENPKVSIFDLLYTPLQLFKKHNIKCRFECNYLAGPVYYQELKDYLSKNYDNMSNTSKNRFDKNAILRILDSKEQEDQDIINNAPKMTLGTNKEYVDNVIEYVKSMGIEAIVNPKLVRGLDYYTGFVFEFININRQGLSQNAIGAGGEYTVKQGVMKNVPAIGLALGANRIIPFLDDIKDQKIAILTDKFTIDKEDNQNYLYLSNQTNPKSIKLAKQYQCDYYIGEDFEGNITKKPLSY